MPTRRRAAETMLRFLALFAGGSVLILFWVTMESLFIKRLTFAYLLRFSLPATLVLLGGLILCLEAYVWLRIVRARPDPAGGPAADDRASRSLLRLPIELFWGTVGYAVLFIPVYHVVHYAVEGHSLTHVDEYYWLNFLRSFLYELAVGLSAAILHYAVARRIIRPALTDLNARGDYLRGRSFLSMLTTTFAALLLINLFSILWYVLVSRVKEEPIDARVPIFLSLLELLFAICIFLLLALEFRRELLVMTGSIRALLGGGREGTRRRPMPILSDDEVGRLAVAFNRLQDRVRRDYDDVAEELRLARQFQLELLPPAVQSLGGIRVSALSEPRREVGSGFYDVLELENGRVAALAGEVSGGGLPAALQMSALLLLLRAEIDREGSPQAMLGRFRQALREVFPREAELSAAIAVFDREDGTLRIATEGRGMNVRWQRSGQPASWSEDERLPFRPGDALYLYSDAALEAWKGASPDSSGRRPTALDAGLPLESQVGDSLRRFRNAPATSGDFTLLVLALAAGQAEAV